MQVDDALERFHEHIAIERNLSENTVAAYMNDLGSLYKLLTDDGVDDIDEIKPTHLTAWLKSQDENGRSARSRARALSACRQFFKFLRIREWLKSNPAATLDAPLFPKTLPDILQPEQVDELIKAIPHDPAHPRFDRDRAMIELLFSCGLRCSEMLDLRLDNLHLAEGFIQVTGKGSKERLVPIGQQAVDTLQDYLAVRTGIFTKPGNKSQIVFINPAGKKLSRMGFWKILQRYARGAGLLEQVHPHMLRHSFATALLRGGADLRSVQTMLGHASITTTEIYTNLDNRDLRRVITEKHPLNIKKKQRKE